MVTTDLGACEWFVWDLRRSNLIDRGQLDQTVGDFLKKSPKAEPISLAEFLVAQGILSQFQADRLLTGKTSNLVLGPYTLMDALGTGSMGTVYKALSKTDNNWYAVKVLPRRSMWNVRLARRQVRAFEQCKHPGVVPFVDVGTAGGTHYLAWPLVEGEPVDKMVHREGKLDQGQAAVIALEAAEALDICHRNGLIHGLVKPSNLMLGGDGQVRILDFGIGTLLSETEGESLVDTMSTSNSLTSGLDCASPESIMDPTQRTPAGDQYSLGCTVYYMLTGQVPFPEGSTVEKMMAHQVKQPTPISELAPQVSPELIAVVDKLMAKAPEDRYSSTAEVVEALRPFAGSTSAAPAPVTTKPARQPAPRGGDNGHQTASGGRARDQETAAQRSASSTNPNRDRQPASSVPSGSTLRNQLLRGGAAQSPAPPVEAPKEEPAAVAATEQRNTPQWSSSGASFEDRVGPIGMVFLGVMLAVMAYVLVRAFGF